MAPCWGPAFPGGPCDTARCRPPARPPGRSCRSREPGRGWAGCRQDRSGAAAVNSRSHRRPHALAAGLSLCVADPQLRSSVRSSFFSRSAWRAPGVLPGQRAQAAPFFSGAAWSERRSASAVRGPRSGVAARGAVRAGRAPPGPAAGTRKPQSTAVGGGGASSPQFPAERRREGHGVFSFFPFFCCLPIAGVLN